MLWSRRTLLIFVAAMAIANGLLIYSWLGVNQCYATGAHFCLGYASIVAEMLEWAWRPISNRALLWQPELSRDLVSGTSFFIAANLAHAVFLACAIGLVKLVKRV